MRRKLFGRDVQDKRYPGPLRRRLQGASGPASSSANAPGVPAHVLPLNESLGKYWAMGKEPSNRMVEYCAGAVLLGARGSEVESFARDASWGKHGQNAQRDLIKAFGHPAGAPNLFRARLPVKGKNGQRDFSDHPFVLPHQLFAQVYKQRQSVFQEHVLDGAAAHQKCWDALGKHKFCARKLSMGGSQGSWLRLGPFRFALPRGRFQQKRITLCADMEFLSWSRHNQAQAIYHNSAEKELPAA